jgi:FimV-like protein
MFIFKRRITKLFFLIPILLLGLTVVPVSHAEKLNANLAKASYGPVTGSDTLGRIVSRNYSGSTLSSQQIMTGILRANPEAFIGGNIHYLLRGSTLLLPKEKLIAAINQNEAEKIIKEHYLYFQRGKTGSFKIAPLVVSNEDSDEVDLARDAASILSDETNSIEINTNPVEKTQPFSSPDVTLSETTITKEPLQEEKQNTEPNVTQSQKSSAGQAYNSLKDIELESLKIKISRLEKILSSRGLSSTISDGVSKEIKNTLDVQKEKIDQLEQEKKNKNNELNQLKEKISGLELSLKKISQSLSDKENLALSSGDEKVGLINQLRNKNIALEKKISSLQSELDSKIKEVAVLSIKIEDSKKTIGELESKLLSSDTESQKLDQKIAEMEAKLAKIRQEPARNLEIKGTNDASLSFGKPLWVWLLPALFLLSILAYLFKRSSSQPKKALVSRDKNEITTQHKTKQEPEAVVIKDKKLTERKKSKTVAASVVPDIVSSASEEESVEASIKLDIAKAYIDMDMPDAAIEILQEAHEEGSNKQCLEAKNLLEKLS